MTQRHIKRIIYLAVLICSLVLDGCKPQQIDELLDAVYHEDLIRIEQLVAKGVVVDGHGYDGWTPLTVAAREGHIEVVRLLVKSGADINAEEGGGNTPLFWAAYYGHAPVVEYLLSSGASKSKKCADCMSVLEAAKTRGYEDVVTILMRQN